MDDDDVATGSAKFLFHEEMKWHLISWKIFFTEALTWHLKLRKIFFTKAITWHLNSRRLYLLGRAPEFADDSACRVDDVAVFLFLFKLLKS